MANSLYNQLNNGNQPNNFFGMVDRFNQFRSQFQGDPQQIVQQLLQSGKMTQAQYNNLSQIATQFQNFLRKS